MGRQYHLRIYCNHHDVQIQTILESGALPETCNGEAVLGGLGADPRAAGDMGNPQRWKFC